MSHGDRPPGTLTALIEELVRSGADGEGDSWTEELRPGVELGRYRLVREIGRGGFGVVWEAYDRSLCRSVALKALRRPGSASRERRLLAEAEVAARLSHPNIVTVLDVGRSERGVYLVQELLTGQSLAQALAQRRIPLGEAVRIGVALANGLAHAHAHGVVHRDLTPANVQLCEDGGVKITDLGMASALGRRKLDGGTPEYMAPEQARGEPEDERTDVFALGAILFRMVAGKPASSRIGLPARGLRVPEAPALAELVESMLAEEPRERPRDACQVLDALAAIGSSLPAGVSAHPSRATIRLPPRRRWRAAGAGAAFAALTVAGLSVVTWGRLAGGSAAPMVLAASSARTACTWSLATRHALGDLPAGAAARNGAFEGQGPAVRDGRQAWLQRSDWNQLFVPIPPLESDVFAIQAEFRAQPASGARREVKLMVFTDPSGPDASDIRAGRGIALLEEPGGGPAFEWGRLDGMTTRAISYRGSLAAGFGDTWRTLRIEGSLKACWLRVLLDGAPLVASVGECDLGGGHVLLASTGGTFRAADVAWRDLQVLRGAGECR